MSRLPCCLALLLLAACNSTPPAARGTPAPAKSAAPVSPAAASAIVTGQVFAPASIVSNNGGALISPDGAGVISPNGTGLVGDVGAGVVGKTKLYKEAPLPGAEVYLADAKLNPLPGIAATKTDAQGRYKLVGAEPEVACLVVARTQGPDGKAINLQVLVTPALAGAIGNPSMASTFVTTRLVGGAENLGKLNREAYERATRATTFELGEADVALLADPVAMLGRMSALEQKVTEIREDLKQVNGELADIKTQLATIIQLLTSPSPGANPQPTPTPSAGSPTASPVSTALPSVSPSATPTPSPTPSADQAPGTIITWAGGAEGFKDGQGEAASFKWPFGIALDAAGNLYVADSGNNAIRKIDPQRRVTTMAGSGVAGWTDGKGAAARFSSPNGVAVDGKGNVYVADFQNCCVRRVAPDGEVDTFAGQSSPGNEDGQGQQARFDRPFGIAIDGADNLYVTDYYMHRVRKITPAGLVSTLTGAGRSEGFKDGPVGEALYSYPLAIAAGSDGTLFLTDGSQRIRKIAGGEVSTLAGGAQGTKDGQGLAAQFNFPLGLTQAPDGSLYAGDNENPLVRKVSPTGMVTTLVGSTPGFRDGALAQARLDHPAGVVADGQGYLYIADKNNHRIRRVRF